MKFIFIINLMFTNIFLSFCKKERRPSVFVGQTGVVVHRFFEARGRHSVLPGGIPDDGQVNLRGQMPQATLPPSDRRPLRPEPNAPHAVPRP